MISDLDEMWRATMSRDMLLKKKSQRGLLLFLHVAMYSWRILVIMIISKECRRHPIRIKISILT